MVGQVAEASKGFMVVAFWRFRVALAVRSGAAQRIGLRNPLGMRAAPLVRNDRAALATVRSPPLSASVYV